MFGNQKVFAKTIEDLNMFSEQGITINVDGCDIQVYFECVLILGDNLGLNSICGFSESFTAPRYCRICSGTYCMCQEMIRENKRLIRTVESYELDVLADNFVLTGIKERCVFNQLKNFHITENISVDVTHDFCEGVIEYSVGKVLDTLVRNNIISLHTINCRIESFPYGELEKPNKPRPLQKTGSEKGGLKLKLKQSAAEMLCLGRYLPRSYDW